MSLILSFDLDDTLYPELTYVRSGMRAVAEWGSKELGWDAETSETRLITILEQFGRGSVFDRWLEEGGRRTKGGIATCVSVYRHHSPDIAPYPRAVDALTRYRGLPFLVTDGHKVVQAKKLDALGLGPFFEHAYLTNRYGRRHAKPSIHCFELIRARTGCDWEDLVYVGDNPAKDFVNLRPLGVRTVRVLTGSHREDVAAPGFEAEYRAESLEEVIHLLDGWAS